MILRILLLSLCLLTCAYAQPIIVIDPGHGGHDPGAVTKSGVAEKNITLAFAQALKQELEANGTIQVVLTRNSDSFMNIDARVAVARKAGARLMISLHADSLSGNPFGAGAVVAGENASVRGATIYTLSETASDSDSAAYAERENNADQMAQFSSGEHQSQVSDILTELTTRETRALSSHFANTLAVEIKPLVRLSKFPIRSARFRVLRAPDVPSLLFEMGYLSSPDDIKLMTSDVWRQAMVHRMAGAIRAFVDGAGSMPPNQ